MFNDGDGLGNVYFLASEGTAGILMRQEKHTKASSTATMKWDIFFFLTLAAFCECHMNCLSNLLLIKIIFAPSICGSTVLALIEVITFVFITFPDLVIL